MKKLLISIGLSLMVFLAIRSLWAQSGQQLFSMFMPLNSEVGKPTPGPMEDLSAQKGKQGEEKRTGPFGLPPEVLENNTLFLLNGTKVAQGASLNALGQGFSPKEEIQFFLSGKTLTSAGQLKSTNADENGSFGVGLSLPNDLTPGKYTLRIVGSQSGKKETVDFDLQSGLPWVEPSLWAGKPNYVVTFSGHGFRTDETIDVFFDSMGGDPVFTTDVDKLGNFEVNDAVIPLTTGGQHAYFFVGRDGRIPVRVPFSVIGLNPWVTLTSYSVQQEDPLGFSLQDFAPGENVRVYLDKIAGEPLAICRVDDTGGTIQDSAMVVPLDTVGMNTLQFVGERSFQVVPVEFEVVPFTPRSELTQYAGYPGIELALKGSGFAKNEIVRVFFGSAQDKKEVSTFQTGDSGTFEESGRFAVPFKLYYGSQPVTVTGSKSKVPVEVTFEVLKFSPWFQPVPNAGPPGASISFLGGGIARNEPITVRKGDASSVVVGKGLADEEGKFSDIGPYVVPVETRGRVIFTVVGEWSGVETTSVYEIVEGEPNPTSPPLQEIEPDV